MLFLKLRLSFFLFEKWSEFSAVLVILFAFIFDNFMIESIFVIVLGAALAMLFFGLMRKQGVFFFFIRKNYRLISETKKVSRKY